MENFNLFGLSKLNLIFYIIIIICNLIFLSFIKSLSEKFKLNDLPNERKLHKDPTSFLGGVFFLISSYFYIAYYKTYFFESHFLIYNLSHVFSLIFISSMIFFLGLLDDMVDMDPLKKTLILTVLISSSILIDSELIIKSIKFELIDKEFNLKNFSVFFTIICIYIFINACNMYDGADLQLGIYFLVFILYLYFKSGYLNIFAPLLIPLLIFLYANFRKICFMGNNGSHFLSYIAAVFVIKLYNKEVFNSVEEIIIIMLIPGCDLVRLFFSRILKKRKFFESDLNHIHHILGKNKSNYTTQIIIFVLTLSPVIISEVSNSYLFGIIFGILIYIFIISRKFNYL